MSREKNQSKKNVPKKDGWQAVRGMRDIIGDEFFQYQGFYEKAAEVALYYGFKPIETPMLEYEDLYHHGTGAGTDIVEKELYALRTKGGDRLALRPEGTPGIMRAYLEHGMQSWPQPVMFYHFGPRFRHDKPQRGRYREFKQFDLDILGTEKSIADAIVIHITTTILREVGFSNLSIEINSVGCKNCRPTFRRELVNYYKKHLGELCKDCHRRLKDNPLRLLDCKVCVALKDEAPTSLAYLCEECKKHFKEVLEYLEALKIQYVIKNSLVRGLDYYTRTVFEISIPAVTPPITEKTESPAPAAETAVVPVSTTDAQAEEPDAPPASLSIAGGGRYDYLAKELGSNKPVPGVGVAMGVDRIVASPGIIELAPRIVKKPKLYFIQLGFEAKLKSLEVIEILREAKIPVLQSLSKDSLGSQLATAEKLKIPYTIILGQKEVIENCVIVRKMLTRSQENVRLEDLAAYLKAVK